MGTKCRYCPRVIERPGPLARHEKKCAPKRGNTSSDVKFNPPPSSSVSASDILMARVDALEKTLTILGRSLPAYPNGILLTSEHAKSNLTQFIMNLESVTKWARELLKMVNDQPAIDWRKEKGLDP